MKLAPTSERYVHSVSEIIAGTRISLAVSNYPGSDGARDIIQELWSAGWTFARVSVAPMDVLEPSDMPRGMSYQWVTKSDREKLAAIGWRAVPAKRHNGVFAPIDYDGDIEVGQSVLMEREKKFVDAAHANNIAKAHKQVDDWAKKFGAEGITGGVRVWTGDMNKPPLFKAVGEPAQAEKVIAQTPQRIPTEAERKAAVPQVAIPNSLPIRKPRYPWLRWLFNLISTES